VTKAEMWIRRIMAIFTFGHSQGWWKEKPEIPGLNKPPENIK